MRRLHTILLAGFTGTILSPLHALGAETPPATSFDAYGAAPAELVQIEYQPDLIIEVGMGVGMAPAYEGSTEYVTTVLPVIRPQYFNIPGFFEFGGNKGSGGFSVRPSFEIIDERVSADHAALQGLNNVDATYALGGRAGYEMTIMDGVNAEVYGAARYAFGGAEGLVGEVGLDVTARLTPQLEVVGGAVVAFAGEDYMDTYFGVTSAESAATGGRLGTYDPTAGIKSAGLSLSMRYEFIPDTFVSLDASYTRLVGDAANSPVVSPDGQNQFVVGVGLSRRFSFDLY